MVRPASAASQNDPCPSPASTAAPTGFPSSVRLRFVIVTASPVTGAGSETTTAGTTWTGGAVAWGVTVASGVAVAAARRVTARRVVGGGDGAGAGDRSGRGPGRGGRGPDRRGGGAGHRGRTRRRRPAAPGGPDHVLVAGGRRVVGDAVVAVRGGPPEPVRDRKAVVGADALHRLSVDGRAQLHDGDGPVDGEVVGASLRAGCDVDGGRPQRALVPEAAAGLVRHAEERDDDVVVDRTVGPQRLMDHGDARVDDDVVEVERVASGGGPQLGMGRPGILTEDPLRSGPVAAVGGEAEEDALPVAAVAAEGEDLPVVGEAGTPAEVVPSARSGRDAVGHLQHPLPDADHVLQQGVGAPGVGVMVDGAPDGRGAVVGVDGPLHADRPEPLAVEDGIGRAAGGEAAPAAVGGGQADLLAQR